MTDANDTAQLGEGETRRERRVRRWAGGLTLALAVAVNPLFAVWLVATLRPGLIELYGLDPVALVVVWIAAAFDLICVLRGLYVLAGRARLAARRTIGLEIALTAAVVLGALWGNLYTFRVVDFHGEERVRMLDLIDSAPAVEELTEPLAGLAESVANLRLPDAARAGLFTAEVEVEDVQQLVPGERTPVEARLGIRRTVWEPDGSGMERRAVSDVALWPVIFGKLRWLDDGRFEVAHAALDDRGGLATRLVFEGRGRDRDGQLLSVRAEQDVRWERDARQVWRIRRWRSDHATIAFRNAPLFAPVTSALFGDAAVLERVTSLAHDERVIATTRDGQPPPYPHFRHWSTLQRPRVTVADLDGDGLEDAYVTRRHGDNLWLRNRGDGTFEERAAAAGLGVGGMSTAARFVDLDNDGDLDALVGRSVLPSMLLIQEDGKWVDRTAELVEGGLPAMVTDWGIADFNRDGLLDVYAATAAPEEQTDYLRAHADRVAGAAIDHLLGIAVSGNELLGDLQGVEAGRALFQRVATGRQPGTRSDAAGPADVLFVNQGGGRLVRNPMPLSQAMRPTVAVDTADHDGDGDPDLLLARRGAPAALWTTSRRPESHELQFTAVAGALAATGTLGTGAAWADVDGDGQLDAVITTGAGRLARQTPLGGGRVTEGSTWTDFTPEGPETHPLTTPGEGGGWRPALADFDRDGRLDLMVPGGTWTPPDALWQGADTERSWWVGVVRTDTAMDLDLEELTSVGLARPRDDAAAPLAAEAADQLWLGGGSGGRLEEASGHSGVDARTDGSEAASLDLDRDGWPDLIVVNANEPSVAIYRNLIGSAGSPAQAHSYLAVRVVGGNRAARRATQWSPRDGTGTRVVLTMADGRTLVRTCRAGRTLLFGLGLDSRIDRAEAHWPSGRKTTAESPRRGQLLVMYEDEHGAPEGQRVTTAPYGQPIALGGASAPTVGGRLVLADRLDLEAPLALFTTMTADCRPCVDALPEVKAAADAFGPAELAVLGVPMSSSDSLQALDTFTAENTPAYRLMDPLSGPERRGLQRLVEQRLGRMEHPASVLTDREGTVLYVAPGVPTVSALRRALASRHGN